MTTITMKLDTSEFNETLFLLREASNAFPNVRNLLIEILDSGVEIAQVDSDGGSAEVADELVVRLKPTVGFRDFVAAVSAGNFDDSVLDFVKNSHKESLS